MCSYHSISHLADQVSAARQSCTSLQPITDGHPDFDLAQAYAVADELHARQLRAGAVFAGRKIGFTNTNMWAEYGVDAPIWGPMYEHSVVHAVAGHARLALAPFHEPKIEPELAFHFFRSPPAHASIAQLLDCIDWMAHGMEVVQSHYPGWRFRGPDAVADGALHGALLLGEPLPVDGLRATLETRLNSVTVALLRGQEQVDTGSARMVLGNPLHALLHLMGELARQGSGGIEAGEIITTGTMTMAWDVSPGQRWSSQLDGMPLQGLTVDFI